MPVILGDFLSDTTQRILVAASVAVVSAAGSFIFGRWWGRRQALRQWDRKEFLGQINVSLNLFENGALKIRTLLETSLSNLYGNEIAIEKLQEAAKHVTPDNAMIPIDPADRWYLLNYVVNNVSEKFVTGLIKQDAGQPAAVVKYLVFLTREVVGDQRVHKIRALVIKKELLENFPYADSMPSLEREWHDTRIHTLRRAAQTFKSTPDLFLQMELSV